MKHVTASEARKNWFKLLDEASNGESIAINRNGKSLVLRLETRKKRQNIFQTTKKSSRFRTPITLTNGDGNGLNGEA